MCRKYRYCFCWTKAGQGDLIIKVGQMKVMWPNTLTGHIYSTCVRNDANVSVTLGSVVKNPPWPQNLNFLYEGQKGSYDQNVTSVKGGHNFSMWCTAACKYISYFGQKTKPIGGRRKKKIDGPVHLRRVTLPNLCITIGDLWRKISKILILDEFTIEIRILKYLSCTLYPTWHHLHIA